MPKGLNLKGFGRRKSSGNALDDFEPDNRDSVAPPQSSFRVIERTEDKPFHGGKKATNSGRTFNSPLNALRGKSVDDLGLSQNRTADSTIRNLHSAWPLNGARGSGGTTNSGSSGYYDSSSASARHSSTSTLPSSLDQEIHEEDLFPRPRKSSATGMFKSVTANADELPPPPSFSSRAARAFSFAGNRQAKSPTKDVPPLAPPHTFGTDGPANPQRSHSPDRERAMTTSSYASTAVPNKIELPLTSTGFGDDDFSSMFDSLKREPQPSPPPPGGGFARTVGSSDVGFGIGPGAKQDSEPMFPPRTLSRNALTPSPNLLKLTRTDSNSPYSWDDQSSNDGLVLHSGLSSPSLPDGGVSPAVDKGIANAFRSISGYSRVPDRYASPNLDEHAFPERSSSATDSTAQKQPAYPNRQTQVDDEDRWGRKVELQDGPPPSLSKSVSNSKLSFSSNSTARPVAGPSRTRAISPNSSTGDYVESNTTTPRAARALKPLNEDSLFNSSPAGAPSRAIRPIQGHQRTGSGPTKKMTKAQFNALKRRDQGSAEESGEEEDSADDYDEEDEIEAAKKLASQRRKQEANMSVYRQQMKKVTGGGPTDLPSSGASTIRPSVDRGSSTPSLPGGGIHLGGIGGQPPEATYRGKQDDDDDDDVPLGILQAHGFPSSSRPPTRAAGDNDMHQRRVSLAGSAVGNSGAGQGSLPAFARRLPVDPYFGAGLVNQSTRESLALNGSGASAVGVSPSQMLPQQGPAMGHPGGLVGVIAGEEKARAARRGSPNAANLMAQGVPLPSNMVPPPMPRTMSMGNLAPPSVYNPTGMPSVPQMLQMPRMGQFAMGMPNMMPQSSGVDPQMQQFMQMQMQLMQNMLNMQQAQMGGGGQTPQPQHMQQQQPGDYLGTNYNNGGSRPVSMASQHSNVYQPNSGRSMTMVNPPTGWGSAANPSGPRPNSSMPMTGGSYAPSVNGLNVNENGNGYAPSIAPSERSNIGMPSRYRPIIQHGEPTARTHSMASSHTLQAFTRQQSSTNLPGTPFNANAPQAPKSTIRIIDKPKGSPKIGSRPLDEDEDEGWADMKKKREDKKKSKWGFRKDKHSSGATHDSSLGDLYQNME